MELFSRFYKKKTNNGWSSLRAAEETFQKLMEDHQPQPTAEDHDTPTESKVSAAITKLWLAVVWVKNKDHVFDLGSEVHVSNQTYTSPSLPPPTPPQPNLAMEDSISRMETMIVGMMP
ncbi:UNVERIFIED_CONTAM: hypothetical protein Sindi_2550100 [Sesamum indicum]